MDFGNFPPKIRECIDAMLERRIRLGEPGYDNCQRLLKYAAEEKSEILFGLGYYSFAEHYLHCSDADNVLYCLTEGIKYFRHGEMYEYLAKAYHMMGSVAETQNNRVVALDYYFTSLQYAEAHNYPYGRALAERKIAGIMFYMKQYERALEMNEKSVSHFEQAPKSFHSGWNIALGKTRIGLCQVELGQPEKAVEIYGQLHKRMAGGPDLRYPVMNIAIMAAYAYEALGRYQAAQGCIDQALRIMYKGISLIENADCVIDLARLLSRMQAYGKQWSFMEFLMGSGIREHLALMLELFPFRSECLYRTGRIQEYMESTRRYFSLYEQYQRDNNRAAARVVELKGKLRSIEKEQDRLLEYRQQLQATARQDAMTGLANRTYLEEVLVRRFEEAYHGKSLLGVELLDIDYFKQYNDTYGHLAGDCCLEKVAGALKQMAGEHVFCARYGGDEFMIIYSGLQPGEITAVAERIQELVRGLAIPHRGSGFGVVTVSQGIFCRRPEPGNKEWDFSSMADITLYEVKRAGRNHYKLCTEFHEWKR